ncbi:hypothetical protein JTE90_027593 [Oedothorax gibbosus]|uniref:C2H2-type domain-containing protein n=1 Tax=Oedothorax gibbosus TaxID=931172 RepID=A0AAV6VL47_9ARAC|nr:hypothetical protein JTE90_027593 [Oedothorax gibbosus]
MADMGIYYSITSKITFPKCSICSRQFSNKSHLKRHFETHQEIKELHSCHICGSSLSRSSTVSYIPVLNQETPLHKCDICYLEFSRRYHLNRHLQTHKEVKEVYTCEICGNSLSRKDHLRKHLRLRHNVILPKGCRWKPDA